MPRSRGILSAAVFFLHSRERERSFKRDFATTDVGDGGLEKKVGTSSSVVVVVVAVAVAVIWVGGGQKRGAAV